MNRKELNPSTFSLLFRQVETVNHHTKAKTDAFSFCLLVLLSRQRRRENFEWQKCSRRTKSDKKLEALSQSSLGKQHRVRCTCGASLSPSAFLHPRPVGSTLPAGTAVLHHLPPLGGHWRVAAAHKPGERGGRVGLKYIFPKHFPN